MMLHYGCDGKLTLQKEGFRELWGGGLMKKMGFTLVELMVAIAIMSILAVLVVPKVASHVVKAKASEISPAAMTYTKLQSAYLYEHKAFGSWRKIGYEAPGGKKAKTETFKYSKGDVTVSIKGEKLSSTLGGDGLVAWQAEPCWSG